MNSLLKLLLSLVLLPTLYKMKVYQEARSLPEVSLGRAAMTTIMNFHIYRVASLKKCDHEILISLTS